MNFRIMAFVSVIIFTIAASYFALTVHSSAPHRNALDGSKKGGGEKLTAMKLKALRGDGDEALNLAIMLMKTDDSDGRYWTQISAENGNTSAQYNLADYYLQDADGQDENYVRAVFWLEKAAGQGDTTAKEKLEELQKRKQ